MSEHFSILRGFALALSLAAPAAAEDAPNADTVVATVNGAELTLGQMISVRESLPAQYQSLPGSVLFDGVLDQLVQQTLLSQSLKGELPKRVALAIETQRLALIANEVVANEIRDKLTEEAIQTAYDARYADFEGAPEFNASHILVETQEAAQAIAEEIRGGADFAETAKAESTGPSGPNGGELGWFGAGQMVAPFEAAVGELEVGQISDPVETQFGWHVIKLNDARTQPAPSLEQVRPELEEELSRAILDEVLAQLETAGSVNRDAAKEIDPALLTKSELLEN